MVSALWKASSEGDLASVHEILKDTSVVDIEIKDHTGVTPLIEAVKNGHLEVVRVLLDKGADPNNSSSHGRPQQYTSDPSILELLGFAASKVSSGGMPHQQPMGYPHDPNSDPTTQYYGMPPPGPYGYYPPGPPIQDGAQAYYPPPLSAGAEQQWPGGPGNLPPPDVARYIPCRYFPACRYGASCIFLHPQAPFYPGPMSPSTQYPGPYDPMVQQGYPPNFYPMPPPSFQPPQGVPQHMNPMSPQPGPHHTPPPPMGHGRSGSEIVSPVQGHFSPNGAPPAAPYGAMSPVSPSYPHPGPPPPASLSIPPLPPVQQAPQGPQSPQTMYANQHPVPAPPPFIIRQDAVQFPSQGINGHVNGHAFPDVNGGPKSPLQPLPDSYGSGQGYREGMGHARRGSIRRGSFAGRKPPCLFFPSGRCKNGDDCRFPHVMPDGPVGHHPGPYAARGAGPRARAPSHVNGNANGNAFKVIEEKFAALAVEQEAHSQQNGTDGSSRSQSTEGVQRPRFPHGTKPNGVPNGTRVDKKPAPKQRVPNADEFPVLNGTPPSGLNGSVSNGHNGPTAAQVLQAPAPFRRDSTRDSTTRSGSPASEPSLEIKSTETNRHPPEPSLDHPVKKLPISFAAVANGAPEVPKEVTVTA